MKREKGIIKENNGGYLNEGTQGFEEYLIKDTEEDNHAVDNVIPRKAEKLGINECFVRLPYLPCIYLIKWEAIGSKIPPCGTFEVMK
jgi:hypothetical protein